MHRKKDDLQYAYKLAKSAVQTDRENLLAMNNLANIHSLLSAYSKARSYYNEVLKEYKNSPEVLFNLSQVELHDNHSVLHREYLDRALKNGPIHISEFMKQNRYHFTENQNSWPESRKVMDIPLQNAHQWKPLTSFFSSLNSPLLKWKAGLIDIPAAYLPIAGILLILYFMFNRGEGTGLISDRPLFICNLCGKAMCNACRSGGFCNTCFQTIQGIPDEKLRSELANHIVIKSRQRKKMYGSIINVVFPGAGNIYLNPTLLNFFILLLTCGLWSCYYFTTHLIKEYPDYVISFAKGPALLLAALYFYFLILAIHTIYSTIRMKTGEQ
jgi:hypothetical protein